jgi:hypothetical protein
MRYGGATQLNVMFGAVFALVGFDISRLLHNAVDGDENQNEKTLCRSQARHGHRAVH